MKVACVLVLCLGLFTASQADTISDLADIGKTVLDGLVEQGKKVVVDAAKDFLDSVLPGLGGLIGKRDMSKLSEFVLDVAGQLIDLADKGKDMVGSVFTDTLNKLRSLTNTFHAAIGSIKDASDVASHIDAVVSDHKVRQKRVIDTLIETGKSLISGAVEKFKGAASMLKQGASAVVSGLLQKGVDLFGFGKRGLTDHLEAIGDALSTIAGPLTDAVSSVGETLKGHFSNLIDTVQGHADALKTKLSPHLDDLKDHGNTLLEHGKNALSALSEVVSDILDQTAKNAGSSLSGISDTLGKAGKTVVDHFSGTDAGSPVP